MKTKIEQDLEKEIKEWERIERDMPEEHKKRDHIISAGTWTHIENKAKLQGYKLAKKEIIEKIEKWWSELQEGDINEYDVVYAEVTYDDFKSLLEGL